MKKRQIIATLSCLMVGMVGFAGAYSMERTRAQEQQQRLEEKMAKVEEDTEELSQVSTVIEPSPSKVENNAEEVTEKMEEPEETTQEEEMTEEQIQQTSKDTAIHFSPEDGLRWPLEGEVILNYSMDHRIFFPTMQQYQYNPAMIIGGEVNSKVYLVAEGTITDITTNEETGCTVTEDLGDGYTAIYGQLKEVNFSIGDKVERGHVIGFVSEPTKYYSMEGSNLYFAMEKDGEPINPLDYFE